MGSLKNMTCYINKYVVLSNLNGNKRSIIKLLSNSKSRLKSSGV